MRYLLWGKCFLWYLHVKQLSLWTRNNTKDIPCLIWLGTEVAKTQKISLSKNFVICLTTLLCFSGQAKNQDVVATSTSAGYCIELHKPIAKDFSKRPFSLNALVDFYLHSNGSWIVETHKMTAGRIMGYCRNKRHDCWFRMQTHKFAQT